jgi:hypothetical protein
MLSLLAILAGGALGAGLYQRFWSEGDPAVQSMAAAGITGAIGLWLLVWLLQTGVAKVLGTVGTLFVLLMIAVTVIPVVVISLLGARKVDDVRVRTKLRWERSHPHVSDLHEGRDE